jgi:hypothetical protein
MAKQVKYGFEVEDYFEGGSYLRSMGFELLDAGDRKMSAEV